MTLPSNDDMQAAAEAAFDEGRRAIPAAPVPAHKPDTAEDVDEETRVLGVCHVELGKLDTLGRSRVLLYLARRYGIDVTSPRV